MATRKQKEKLVETLKFVPYEINIMLSGYGGEIVLGTISQEQYEFWQDRTDELAEYACWGSDETEIEENFQMFESGSWYDCDNIAHETGVEMNAQCWLTVSRVDNDEVLFQSRLDRAELSELGIETEEVLDIDLDNLEPGTHVFGGQNVEKGVFFNGTVLLDQPFDSALIKLDFVTVNYWPLCNNVFYRDEAVDGCDGYSTSGKSSDFWVAKVE